MIFYDAIIASSTNKFSCASNFSFLSALFLALFIPLFLLSILKITPNINLLKKIRSGLIS